MTYEEGHNREIASMSTEFYHVWQLKTWGLWGKAYSSAAKPFEAVMKLKWDQLIENIADESTIKPWLASYRKLFRALAFTDDITPYQVERWVDEKVAALSKDRSAHTPLIALCLGIIKGSEQEIRPLLRWGSAVGGGGAGGSSYGGWWSYKQHQVDPLLLLLADPSLYDGSYDYEQILEKDDFQLLVRGLRNLVEEEHFDQ